jgi:hypothetical protein
MVCRKVAFFHLSVRGSSHQGEKEFTALYTTYSTRDSQLMLNSTKRKAKEFQLTMTKV